MFKKNSWLIISGLFLEWTLQIQEASVARNKKYFYLSTVYEKFWTSDLVRLYF